MEASNLSPLLLFFFYFSLLQTSIIATKKSYIVYLGSERSSSLDPSSLSEHSRQVTAFHYDLLGTLLGSQKMTEEAIFYSYTTSFNGFAAKLDEKEAANLARNPKVISVFENKARKLHTTRSWNFLGVENDVGIPSNSIWNAAKFGQDIIIANIDTGVWPESKSFSDEGYGPVPSKWRGICQTDSNFHCNRKLIGGRYFYKGYVAAGGTLNATSLTVRDHDGHGTHTLSTAAGNFVTGANVFGHGSGTAKGGAPKARVAAYKVCWPPFLGSQCLDADILAAFEAAVADGVDVISTSLGGAADEYFNDPLAIAAFHAVQQGVVVVFSAGNSGPFPMTVTNIAPWINTVAAGTVDRDFASNVALGNKEGVSLSSIAPLPKKFYPLIDSVNAKLSNVTEFHARFCGEGTLDPMKVKGKIVICQVGEIEGVEKSYQAARAGAVGVIVANDIEKGDEIYPELHFIPASDITNNDAQLLQKYLNSTTTPMAHLTKVKTLLNIKPAPIIATFSSRGPNPIDPFILKPDITAPGVNILASYSTGNAPTFSSNDQRRIPFNVISGTSMSCPHIAGIAGLLKSIHPDWSPAAIKSAIMTTAKTRGNNLQTILDSTKLKATSYAYGAGMVHPNDARDPGLVYDTTIEDYLNFLCARGYNAMEMKKFYAKPFNCVKSFKATDLNYPSISVGVLRIGAPVTINRRVKSVGSPGTYVARVKVSPGVAVLVEPRTLQFSSVGEEKAFKVVLQNTGKVKRGDVFGTLIWSDGKHFVRSPIAVHLGPGSMSLLGAAVMDRWDNLSGIGVVSRWIPPPTLRLSCDGGGGIGLAMEAFNLSSLLLLFFLFPLLQTSTIATQKSYIVYLGSHSHGSNPSSVDLQIATESHYSLLGSLLGSNEAAKEAIFYSYNRHINGFAAMLDHKVAEDLARNPAVASVHENKGRKLHTTSSWKFLGVEHDDGIPTKSIWNLASFGESTIIANLDTGVWPESKSFSDEGYGPVPTRWKGSCEGGSKFHCNRKLIGARYFNKGYAAYVGSLNATYETARDHDGHGTHTLSTAGGNFISGANVFGNGNGTAKGGSPKALVAAYKVCWPPVDSGGSCFDADILAAIEAAISDGVDVLSLSLGGDSKDFSDDVAAIGAFHAVQQGIVVVCSAGNSGPAPGTVENVAPWIFTVGASTINREFTSYVALGNKKHIKGASLSDKILPAQKFYPLISAAYAKANHVSFDDAQLCEEGSLDPRKVKGKIIICLRGENARVDKGYVAAQAGAVGMILANTEQNEDELIADAHLLPVSHVSYTDGQSIYQYINSTKTPMAYMTHARTELGIKPAPVMASFSSRGPNTMEESILKPDITAPGVNILAAYSEDASPSGSSFDNRRIPFNIVSGTSMSCPHISGIVGLLKTLYPKWSPAAIKSAIMTTAETRANDKHPILNTEELKANPFAYGAGHVQPNRAMNPGLVYDLTTKDYLNFLCVLGYNKTQISKFSNTSFVCSKSFKLTDFNYPSISIPNMKPGLVTIKRRVKNVGKPSTYVARVKVPPGASVSVKPSTLKFTGIDEEKSFKVIVGSVADNKHSRGYVFGSLVWEDGKHHVRSPIVVNLG
ncbi:uncharacterized protein LOC120090550 [Benincasa hispida]|uniref:uncharacterized protein LOC120090550 n=1 Tax=Benincasa hispida TaxID=102211 RepID=UPI0018FFEF40|nr:uncharacterized protein LOC120090550 [Benincasa hispida]